MQVLTCIAQPSERAATEGRTPASGNIARVLTQETVLAAAADAGLTPCSIVVRRLDSGEGPDISIEPQRYLYPASMLKVPLALATLALVQSGDLRLDQPFEVTHANMTANDKPSPMVPGYAAPLREIVELAITISDNVATNMLYDIVGRERATAIVQQRFGLTTTSFARKLSGSEPLIHDAEWDGERRNRHNAGDAARLYELIARDRVPFAHLLRETLARQQFNNKLSAGLLPGDRFAHKTGDTDEVTHDGGILDTFLGASYAIVVYAGLEATDSNNARFGPFMNQIRALL